MSLLNALDSGTMSTFLNSSDKISCKEDNMPNLKMLPVAAEYHMLLM